MFNGYNLIQTIGESTLPLQAKTELKLGGQYRWRVVRQWSLSGGSIPLPHFPIHQCQWCLFSNQLGCD